jgi:hypothetical protein
MNWWWVVGAVAIALFALRLSQVAGRLDRLHLRIEAARNALDVQLARRSGLVTEIASSGLLDPASSLVLSDAAAAARDADFDDVLELSAAESELTQVLAATFDQPEDVAELKAISASMSDTLDAACRRVQLARRFHNDAVRACLLVRERRVVELFRLAGHTPLPEMIEMNDSLPSGFGTRQ